MSIGPPQVTGVLKFVDPPSSPEPVVLLHLYAATREPVPITLAGHAGRVYFSPATVETNYGEFTVEMDMKLVFDPPLSLRDVVLLAGAEVAE